jgi:hypothetical protein
MYRLEHLEFKGHYDLSTKTVLAFIKSCPKLRSFPVVGNTRSRIVDALIIEQYVNAHPHLAGFKFIKLEEKLGSLMVR